MTAHAATFDQMGKAEKTLAVVLWAKNAKNVALAAVYMAVLHQTLTALVRSLGNEDELACLSDEQATELATKLQEVHSQLDFLLHRPAFKQFQNKFFFKASYEGIEEGTVDLVDVIEDLLLSCNKDFRAILGECVQALPNQSAGLIARM